MPPFLAAAAHPVRWSLLRALSQTDLRVYELVRRTGHAQNLVSYHLGRLRQTGLVVRRRSSADGRDGYYRLDLARCAGMLSDTGGRLHPGLRLAPRRWSDAVDQTAASGRRARVLFLCTGNSSRSQMAEALLWHRSRGSVQAFSAGSTPRPVHPMAVAAMADRGIDISHARPKHYDTFTGEAFDAVVTVCDRVREVCPTFPGAGPATHWSMGDPAADPDGFSAFVRVAAELDERIGFLLLDPFAAAEPEAGTRQRHEAAGRSNKR